MKRYRIINAPMSDAVPAAPIDVFRWDENGYKPASSARLSVMGDTLFVRLRTEETDPLIRYHRGDADPHVWCDSCLEFFFSAEGSSAYVNLEMNADGCYICNVGDGRGVRVPCDPFAENGKPVATVGEGFWQVDAALSLKKMASVFGVDAVTSLCGNFYKCGDDTAFPHFGSWAEIDNPYADFHRPEFFAPILFSEEA